jgi:hypothetical protein
MYYHATLEISGGSVCCVITLRKNKWRTEIHADAVELMLKIIRLPLMLNSWRLEAKISRTRVDDVVIIYELMVISK